MYGSMKHLLHWLLNAFLFNQSKIDKIIIHKWNNIINYDKNYLSRLNYSANYADVEGVIVTAIDFGRIAGLRSIFPDFLTYFVDRGYTENEDIQIASYDWRLAPGKQLTH